MHTGDGVVRIGLVHPLRAWLDALECLLDPHDDVDLVVAHVDPNWIRNAVERGHVDLVLISLDSDILADAVVAMRRARRDVDVVVISDSESSALIYDVVRAGARGWISSTSSLEHLLDVVHGVRRGESWFPPMHVTRLVDTLLDAELARAHQVDALAPLSDREREILDCLAQGMTRHEIAEQLFLSPHTVRTHINNVLRKLKVHSTLAAVSLARKPAPTPDPGVNGEHSVNGVRRANHDELDPLT